MTTTEHTINDALAAVLRTTRSAWSQLGIVSSENTGILKHGAKRPDILVTEPNVSPVVIETEVMPAATVEVEAISRLGEQIKSNGRTILSSIAVRLPSQLRTKSGTTLTNELVKADDLDVAIYTGDSPTKYSRWPQSGWIRASIEDLSILTQSATVPPEVIDKAADHLVSGVSDAAGLLEDMAASHPGRIHKISEELRQEDGEQTRRMAATILANAFVFMESLAGGPGRLAKVRSINELRNSGGLSQKSVLEEWERILAINYWPIFDIARKIFGHVPVQHSMPLIECFAATADRLIEKSLMRSHDLTGAVFQRLIADRTFLAAYYTTPAAASLLAGLSINPDQTPSGSAWSDAKAVKALRIADFACGTGTLISTSYQRVGQIHELAGGDAEALHPEMMAESLVGCDVLPAAAHLTASMLAGAYPTTKYTQSSILTVVYGKQPDGRFALGSLDLLDAQAKLDIVFSTTAKAAGGLGEEDRATWAALPHSSFDLVIMNPPFVRDTGHEGKKKGVPNPMFAAFSITKDEQKKMAGAVKRLTVGTSAHGNAGEASIFLVLANEKLRPKGTLALVMPLSLMSGEAWEKSRHLLATSYRDLVLVSITGAADDEMSFSADTDMGECLVVGRKSVGGSARATFVILNKRPPFQMLGASIATQIRRLVASKNMRRLEDGPVGGSPLYFGDDRVGYALDAPLPPAGEWNPVRIADLSIAQSAYQMITHHRLWLPSMNEADALPIPITNVEAIGKIGPYHADINGKQPDGSIRGPFDVEPVKSGDVPTHPVIWAHSAENQRSISCPGESQGIPRKSKSKHERTIINEKVAKVWESASHAHFNRDFRFNSQSTGMQFTPNTTIGGRAWISIKLATVKQEKALVLWANTSLGFLLHWHHANRQQSGRGSIGVLPLKTLPILDVATLNRTQLDAAEKLFTAVAKKDLLAAHRLDADLVRRELDERFGTEILGLPHALFAAGGPVDLLRRKLSAEPSVRGSK